MNVSAHCQSFVTGHARLCLATVLLACTIQACGHRPAAPLTAETPATGRAAETRTSASYGHLPMAFEANHGQSDARVQFLARGPGYTLFLTPTEAVLSLRAPTATPATVVRMRLEGTNPRPTLTGLDRLAGESHYFIGNDPDRWRRDVPNHARVHYAGVYPGIDVIYYGNQRQLEYDFVVAPQADPGHITLAFDGVEQLSIDPEGNLLLHTAHGNLAQRKPEIYQDIRGERRRVDGRYVLQADDRVGFEIPGYDATQPLVIDPVLSYSTYLGGFGNDSGLAIAVDSTGSTYVTGSTRSTNFPGAGGGPIQPGLNGSDDVFVAKLNAAGSAFVYCTYLGGSASDIGRAIAVDGSGNAYVTGETDSPTQPGPGNIPFPIVGAIQPVYGLIGDAFVTKLDFTGGALAYSTYLGGSGTDRGYGIALDGAGNAYVTGHTNSLNFPVAAPFQVQNGSPGGYDAFVSKVNAAGSALVYSTYLGGNANEFSLDGGAIAVDSLGSAYVGGSTASANFPGVASSTIQPNTGGGLSDGFVVKFSPAGHALVYSTYLGGTGYDAVNGLALDAGLNAYVVGYTDSPNFPIAAPMQATRNGVGNDAFVSKLNAAGSALAYSTYLGGSGGDIAYAVAVDADGDAHLSGWTNSSNFPTVAPLQALNSGSGEAFVSELEADGSALVFSTFWGGSTGTERGYGIALDGAGNAFVTGETNSSNFPVTSGTIQVGLGGFTDAFAVRFGTTTPATLRAPVNLVATSIVGNTVTIAWTAPANSIAPTGYVLEGGIVPGEVLASLPTGSTTPAYTFTASTGTFYIRVHSVAPGLRSVASNEIRILVNVPAPPSAPANLLAFANGSDLGLAWTNTAAGGTPTRLILDVSGSLALSLIMPVSETFTYAGVPAGTYTLSLRAANGTGVSGSSNPVTLTFPAACSGAPAPPANAVATSLGNLITVSWGLPASGPAPTSYTLHVQGAYVGALQMTTRSISGTVGPGSYFLTVTATNPCGTSAGTTMPVVNIP